ncbi:MAG: CRISPR-associated endoribonuclease Cas6 [Prochloraceae cyanobacterium]|nr:CRISPR-associated endoribonuclease Cas6 [Prochloraceae cyanobacterium]
MPHSLVINILPLSPISVNYLTGKHLHALLINLVSKVDPNLSECLHQSHSNKAFSISPIQITSQHFKHALRWGYNKTIPAATPVWWRISLLDERLFSRLTGLWLNLTPKGAMRLGDAQLQITSILGTPQTNQPWANACSYAQLYEKASALERSFTFCFATPTTFRQGKYDTPLPAPESVFKSLQTRWNKYSNKTIDRLPVESLFPSVFDIRTQKVINFGSKIIGCTGVVTYSLLGEVQPIQIKQFNALADFALYCGVGRKTTMGMGMVRRVGEESNK